MHVNAAEHDRASLDACQGPVLVIALEAEHWILRRENVVDLTLYRIERQGISLSGVLPMPWPVQPKVETL